MGKGKVRIEGLSVSPYGALVASLEISLVWTMLSMTPSWSLLWGRWLKELCRFTPLGSNEIKRIIWLCLTQRKIYMQFLLP
jgi:hypothetical protein